MKSRQRTKPPARKVKTHPNNLIHLYKSSAIYNKRGNTQKYEKPPSAAIALGGKD